eukprot:TRINITY_DN59731_c0_g1_i1.p1 TRINITY_DN59731_c0_g1~~TRINITY_DN59731_c0_g1_i1.p1  ORF type:complete len:705 (-),score=35.70 TRINITY_DN59731_c0_g1_i1:200-2314(-)
MFSAVRRRRVRHTLVLRRGEEMDDRSLLIGSDDETTSPSSEHTGVDISTDSDDSDWASISCRSEDYSERHKTRRIDQAPENPEVHHVDADTIFEQLPRLLLHNFRLGLSLVDFASRHVKGVGHARYTSAVRTFMEDTITVEVHPDVALTERWTVKPRTFFVRDVSATLGRWLTVCEERGLLVPACEDALSTLVATVFWDGAARSLCNYHITALLVSFPFVFRASGAISAVFPLLIHCGPLGRGGPVYKGKGAARQLLRVQPPVLQKVMALANFVVRGLRLGSNWPVRFAGRPVEVINVSDLKAAVQAAADGVLTAPNVPQFPFSARNRGRTEFRNQFVKYQTSPACALPIGKQMSACTRPATTCQSRGPVAFFPSATGVPVLMEHFYLRHGQLHGVPAILADMAQAMFVSVASDVHRRRAARRLAAAFPPPYAPLAHVDAESMPSRRAAGGDKEGAAGPAGTQEGAAMRPVHDTRLKDVKRWLRGGHFGSGPTVGDVCNLLEEHGRLFPCADEAGRPVSISWAALFRSALAFARLVLDPTTLPSDDDCSRQAVVTLGQCVFACYKAFLATEFPWQAQMDTPWFKRLPQVEQNIILGVRFQQNRTCCHVGSHEFFCHGARAVRRWGRQAIQVTEEAFEHGLSYYLTVATVMAGRDASLDRRLCSSVYLMWAAAWSGAPRMQSAGVRTKQLVNQAYDSQGLGLLMK